MSDIDEVKQFIMKIESSIKSPQTYERMSLEELSFELRKAMINQNTIQESIENFEEKGINSDFIEYARIVCTNITERQMTMIQENYFEKLDRMLQSK